MSTLSNQTLRRLRSLAFLALILGILLACGGPEPTPQIVVVTNTFTPEVQVQVVTATFTPVPLVVTATSTPIPEVEPTDTEAPPTDTQVPPTEAPEPTVTLVPTTAPVEFILYDHPSGAFSLEIPENSEWGEEEEGLYLAFEESLVMIFFTPLDEPITTEELGELVPVIMDDVLIGEELITDYWDLESEPTESGNAYVATFGASSEDHPEGEGMVIVWYVDQTVYFLVLLTAEFGDVEAVWDRMIDSLEVNPPAPPEPPTAAPEPTAKPTAKPKPKPTATTASAPPPQANKGCYLFENQLGVDLTITFTARDWQWSDTFAVKANESKEYCFDPGRYTYTLDAPPPWGSTNGELEVQAGDRYRFPIRGN